MKAQRNYRSSVLSALVDKHFVPAKVAYDPSGTFARAQACGKHKYGIVGCECGVDGRSCHAALGAVFVDRHKRAVQRFERHKQVVDDETRSWTVMEWRKWIRQMPSRPPRGWLHTNVTRRDCGGGSRSRPSAVYDTPRHLSVASQNSASRRPAVAVSTSLICSWHMNRSSPRTMKRGSHRDSPGARERNSSATSTFIRSVSFTGAKL